MLLSQLKPETHETLQRLLGYLNFSSGAPDTQFLAGLDDLFEKVHEFLATTEGGSSRTRTRQQPAAWRIAVAALINKLSELKKDSPTFRRFCAGTSNPSADARQVGERIF